jgi:ribose 1,5-bisphosphate isomerase
MTRFEDVLAGIRELRIQGATSIARAGIEALAEELARADGRADVDALCARLFATRPNEPMLRNLVHVYLAELRRHGDGSPVAARSSAERLLSRLSADEARMAEVAARLVEGKQTVFTHCHSSTVTRALRLAAERGARFTVYCTETRPRYQGRITARELAEAGIEVVQLVDSAALLGLRRAEVFLLGADAVLATGFFINKVGSALLALAAERLEVPLYVCCHTAKFDLASLEGQDEPIEERDPAEVWPDASDGVLVRNPAFERVPVHSIEAFVTEHGLLDLRGVQQAAANALRA